MATTGTIDRDGFALEWVREGAGTPMMVLGSHRFYRRYYPRALREHFDMVFCDLRQWAPTPPGYDVSTITRETFADDVEAVRQATGLDRPIVGGHSQHGSLALVCAESRPDRVRGALLVAPLPPAGSAEGLESSDEFFLRDADEHRRATHEHNLATRRVPASIETSRDFIDAYVAEDATGWYDATFDSSPLWEDVEINLAVEDQVFAPEVLGDWDLQPLDAPVFLALGRFDYGVPFYEWEEPKKSFSNLRYKLYPRSGHHPPYEQPDEFAADVVEWARTL